MRTNEEIRAPSLRVIDAEGNQIGVIPRRQALQIAQEAQLDLVEIVPNSDPPVCKIIDYGKFRYDQTKREKESKKAQVQIKVKEIKLKPNIDKHDFDFKVKRAQQFLEKGHKVKVTCMFRGREMMHTDVGHRVVQSFIETLDEWGSIEAPPKQIGRTLLAVLAPNLVPKRKKAS